MANPGMRHAYKLTKSDPVDTTLVGATKWNDRHYFLEDDGATAAGTLGDLLYRGTDGLGTLLTGAQGVLTSAGSDNVPAWSMNPSITTIVIGGVTINATEAGFLDGVTAGTVTASKALVVDANKDIASLRNLTLTGVLNTGASVLAGNLTFSPDATYDIGAPGSTRPRRLYLSDAITAGGGASFGSSVAIGNGTAFRWDTRSSILSPADSVVLLQNAAFNDFSMLKFGGTTSSFPALKRSAVILETKLADDSAYATHAALTFQTMTALVALGGGAAPILGTIGGSGPATAAQNTWLRMIDSAGAAFWVPAWK